jgi:hypothetical protein
MLVTGLLRTVILVIGEVTRLWNRVEPIISKTVAERSLTHAATRILPTDPSIPTTIVRHDCVGASAAFWSTSVA